jgi:uncharacterized protein DUF4384
MTPRAGTWVIGLAGSLVAHAGILLLLLITVRPEPVPQQPMPTSELEVQAYQLDRTQAREQQPQSQQTKADTPDGTALDAGAIPQSRANPARAVSEPLPAQATRAPAAVEVRRAADVIPQTAASGTSIAQIAPFADQIVAQRQAAPKIEAATVVPVALTQTETPVFATVAAVIRSQSALPVAMPAVATLPVAAAAPAALPAALPAVAVAQQYAPQPAALPQAVATPDDVPAATPRPVTAASRKVDAARVQPATPSAQKLKAALAFSGAEGDVDPVSIAAFQSFMRPGDIAASGDQLRDGVTGLLAQVPCSRMQVVFDPDTATLNVVGHIPDNDLRAPVLAALRAEMGANITVSDNILILPRPQCGALSGIADVGLPQSTDQITNPLVIGKDAQATVFNFAKGELLSLDMTAPDYAAYIYLDYFDADGNVLHIEPNQYAPLRQADAKTVQQIGAKTMEDSGLKLVIGPPYGQEIAVAFAASEPLYEGFRPIQEPAAGYLEWLKEQVANARADNPDFKGEWVYFFVSTTEG